MMAEGSRWDRPELGNMKIGPDPHYDDGTNQGEPPSKATQRPNFTDEPVPSRPPWTRLELTDAVIQKNAVGHYYVVGYLHGGIRVAGWLHERPLAPTSDSKITLTAKEGENGPPA